MLTLHLYAVKSVNKHKTVLNHINAHVGRRRCEINATVAWDAIISKESALQNVVARFGHNSQRLMISSNDVLNWTIQQDVMSPRHESSTKMMTNSVTSAAWPVRHLATVCWTCMHLSCTSIHGHVRWNLEISDRNKFGICRLLGFVLEYGTGVWFLALAKHLTICVYIDIEQYIACFGLSQWIEYSVELAFVSLCSFRSHENVKAECSSRLQNACFKNKSMTYTASGLLRRVIVTYYFHGSEALHFVPAHVRFRFEHSVIDSVIKSRIFSGPRVGHRIAKQSYCYKDAPTLRGGSLRWLIDWSMERHLPFWNLNKETTADRGPLTYESYHFVFIRRTNHSVWNTCKRLFSCVKCWLSFQEVRHEMNIHAVVCLLVTIGFESLRIKFALKSTMFQRWRWSNNHDGDICLSSEPMWSVTWSVIFIVSHRSIFVYVLRNAVALMLKTFWDTTRWRHPKQVHVRIRAFISTHVCTLWLQLHFTMRISKRKPPAQNRGNTSCSWPSAAAWLRWSR